MHSKRLYSLYAVSLVLIFLLIDAHSHSVSDTLIIFSVPFVVLSLIVIWKHENSIPHAKEIHQEIQKAENVLLHCHPSPDPDSVGSALAMKFALESMGKKVTVFRGDSEIPGAFMHFPGASEIVMKNFFEMDLSKFDLFIVLDSSQQGVSRLPGKEVVFPPALRVVNIDHHRTNTGCGQVNLIDPAYPATCLILADLFKEWKVELTPNIASNLFIGAYTDTGGFKYDGVTAKTFATVSELVKHIPNLPLLISKMENSNTPGLIAFEAAALSSIDVYHGVMAVSSVPFAVLESRGMKGEEIKPGMISSILKSVPQWKLTVSAAETAPGIVKCSFRSSDVEKFDVSKLAAELGGGGHKGAAGALLSMPLDAAIKKVVETAKILYNL